MSLKASSEWCQSLLYYENYFFFQIPLHDQNFVKGVLEMVEESQALVLDYNS
jgi:hypothetical protein